MKERDRIIDYYRGICMLLVIYCHCNPILWGREIRLFVLQGFFFVSGILYAKKREQYKKQGIIEYTRKKTVELMILYYKWGAIAGGVYLLVTPGIKLFSKSFFKQLMTYLLGARDVSDYCFTGTLWFVTVLLTCTIAFYICDLISNNEWTLLFAVIVIVIVGMYSIQYSDLVLPLNLDLMPYVIAFYGFGCFIFTSGVYEWLAKSELWIKNIVLVAVFCFFSMITKLSDIRVDIFTKMVTPFVPYLLGGILGCIMILAICTILDYMAKKRNIAKLLFSVIGFVGVYSLEYMVIHQQIFLHIMNIYGMRWDNPKINFVIRFLVAFLGTTVVVMLIDKFKKRKMKNGI